MKNKIIIIALTLPFFASGQIRKFDFEKISDTEYFAIIWISEDSIISHDKVLILPISATNDEMIGCMCMVKADSCFKVAAILCSLTEGKMFRELSNQEEKDYILRNKRGFAFSIKSNDPSIFWWSKEPK